MTKPEHRARLGTGGLGTVSCSKWRNGWSFFWSVCSRMSPSVRLLLQVISTLPRSLVLSLALHDSSRSLRAMVPGLLALCQRCNRPTARCPQGLRPPCRGLLHICFGLCCWLFLQLA